MRRVRQHALPVVKAAVTGDLRRTIQHAHMRVGGRQGQGRPRASGGMEESLRSKRT